MPLGEEMKYERGVVKAYIDRFIELEKNDYEVLYQSLKVKTFSKGSKIVYSDNNRNIYIVISGLCRGFVKVAKSEVTVAFYQKSDLMASFESLLENDFSKMSFEFIEHSKVVELDSESFVELSKGNRNFEKLWRYTMEDYLIKRSFNVKRHLHYSVKERYLLLLKEHPDFFMRISLKYIASYLGIKPQSLSRIRRELTQRIH